jgi:hypothetical protein
VETAAYIEAVAQHHSSLEHLSLLKYDRPPEGRTVGANLGIFKMLKSLDIQCTTLFSCSNDGGSSLLERQHEIDEFLPRSLENLTLRYDMKPSEDLTYILKRLADAKEVHFPQLRRIIVKEGWNMARILEAGALRLRTADCVSVFNAVGVELVGESAERLS